MGRASSPALAKTNLGWPEGVADRLGHLAAAGVVLVDEQQPVDVAARVLVVFAGAHVEHLLADALGLIPHPLEAVDDGHQGGQRLQGNPPLLLHADEVGVELVPLAIDQLLGLHGPPGQGGVLGEEGLDGGMQHRDGPPGQLAVAFGGQGELERAEDDHLAGDALGVVTDPLELGVDLDGGVGEAQRAGHRLLAHDELQAEPIDLLLQLVDTLVAHDHRIGGLAVAFGEGPHRGLQGSFGQAAHLSDLRADAFDVALEGLFVVGHGRLPTLRRGGRARAASKGRRAHGGGGGGGLTRAQICHSSGAARKGQSFPKGPPKPTEFRSATSR